MDTAVWRLSPWVSKPEKCVRQSISFISVHSITKFSRICDKVLPGFKYFLSNSLLLPKYIAQSISLNFLILFPALSFWDTKYRILKKINNYNFFIVVLLDFRYIIRRTLKKLDLKEALIRIPVNLTYVPIDKMQQPPWVIWWFTA